MPTGVIDQTFLLSSMESIMRSLVWRNNFVFDSTKNGNLFLQGEVKTGTQIEFPIEYSRTNNAGTFTYDSAMKESNYSNGVIAKFTKDSYDAALRIYKLLQRYSAGAGDRVTNSNLADALTADKNIQNTAADLRSTISATCIADMETQIDSSGNYSDVPLLRSTYGLASYENTAGGIISQTIVEDTVASLMSPTYGECDPADLVLYTPLNQFKRIARMQSATIGTDVASSLFPMVSSAQDPAPIDVGRFQRTKTFDGIPIIVVPQMTTTNILILRRGTWYRYDWMGFEMEDKSSGVQAFQELYNFVMGVNVVCDMPSWNAKISGLTA